MWWNGARILVMGTTVVSRVEGIQGHCGEKNCEPGIWLSGILEVLGRLMHPKMGEAEWTVEWNRMCPIAPRDFKNRCKGDHGGPWNVIVSLCMHLTLVKVGMEKSFGGSTEDGLALMWASHKHHFLFSLQCAPDNTLPTPIILQRWEKPQVTHLSSVSLWASVRS